MLWISINRKKLHKSWWYLTAAFWLRLSLMFDLGLAVPGGLAGWLLSPVESLSFLCTGGLIDSRSLSALELMTAYWKIHIYITFSLHTLWNLSFIQFIVVVVCYNHRRRHRVIIIIISSSSRSELFRLQYYWRKISSVIQPDARFLCDSCTLSLMYLGIQII